MDKAHNSLVTLPGVPGAGKSTFMAHFGFSEPYLKYAAHWGSNLQPLVSLFTYNSGMEGGNVGSAPGLRLVYGALHSSCGCRQSWVEFSNSHAGLYNMTASEAVTILRDVFGKERRILICVDELNKVDQVQELNPKMNAEYVLSQLCSVLSTDGKADLLVSALNPHYIDNLLTGSQRSIKYVPITPLRARQLEGTFRQSGVELVRQVREEVGLPLNIFSERILRNVHQFASGHPRTLEKLKDDFESGAVLQAVKGFWEENDLNNPNVMLHDLTRLGPLAMYSTPPTSREECEYILSMHRGYVADDALFRLMLESKKCFIFGPGQVDGSFRITTSLASFFKMVKSFQDKDNCELGPVSRAAKLLFSPTTEELSELWERAHGLSVVSRVHHLRETARGKSVQPLLAWVCGVPGASLRCRIILERDIEVIVAQSGTDIQWKQNTLYISPRRHPGSDLALCLLGTDGRRLWSYEEVKITASSKNTSTAEIMADKLPKVLVDHLQRAQILDQPLDDQMENLQNVYFVLSRYGCEMQDSMDILRDEVVRRLEQREKNCTKREQLLKEQYMHEKEKDKQELRVRQERQACKLALGYIKRYWHDHVALQSTAQMEVTMVPATLPLAQLVQDISIAE